MVAKGIKSLLGGYKPFELIHYYLSAHSILHDAITKQTGLNVQQVLSLALDKDPIGFLDTCACDAPTKEALKAGILYERNADRMAISYCQTWLRDNEFTDCVRVDKAGLPAVVKRKVEAIDARAVNLIKQGRLQEAQEILTYTPVRQFVVVLRSDSIMTLDYTLEDLVRKLLDATNNDYALVFLHLLRVLSKVNVFGEQDYTVLFNNVCGDKDMLDTFLANIEFNEGCDANFLFHCMSSQSPNWNAVEGLLHNREFTVSDIFNVLENLTPSAIKNCDSGKELLELVKRHLR